MFVRSRAMKPLVALVLATRVPSRPRLTTMLTTHSAAVCMPFRLHAQNCSIFCRHQLSFSKMIMMPVLDEFVLIRTTPSYPGGFEVTRVHSARITHAEQKRL